MGGFAEKAIANAATTIVLPESVDFVTAAGMMLTYGTAYHALVDRAALRAGEWLYVSGAGGGVGTASVDLAKALGAHVVATASSDAKRAAVKRAGADFVLDAGAPDLVDAMKKATGGGINVAIDNVGGEQFDTALRAARPRRAAAGRRLRGRHDPADPGEPHPAQRAGRARRVLGRLGGT